MDDILSSYEVLEEMDCLFGVGIAHLEASASMLRSGLSTTDPESEADVFAKASKSLESKEAEIRLLRERLPQKGKPWKDADQAITAIRRRIKRSLLEAAVGEMVNSTIGELEVLFPQPPHQPEDQAE
jgi:hypothetical protein